MNRILDLTLTDLVILSWAWGLSPGAPGQHPDRGVLLIEFDLPTPWRVVATIDEQFGQVVDGYAVVRINADLGLDRADDGFSLWEDTAQELADELNNSDD